MLADLFSSVLMLSIMASAIICLIFITKFTFREKLSARWHYYIWIILFIRLVIPFTPQYSLDFGNLFKQPQTEVSRTVEKSKTEINESKDSMNNSKTTGIEQETFALKGNQVENVQANIPQEKHNNISIRKSIELAAMIWGLGVVLLLVYSLVVNILIRCRIRRAKMTVENDRITDIIEECKKSMGITGRIPVVYQSYVSAPALYGIIRPVLLMAPDIANHLNEEELRYVVLHELCHYRRKDNAAGLILMLLNTIHWFNPLMWLAANKIKEDRELVCDEQALSYVGAEEKRNYARTIVKILELFSQKQVIISASSIIQGRASNMEWRIKFIKAIKRKSSVLAIFVTLLVFIAGVLTVNYINGSVKLPKSVYAVSGEEVDTKQRGAIVDRNGVKLVERTSEKSSYKYGNLASHVIGSVNKENNGIEAAWESSGAKRNDQLQFAWERSEAEWNNQLQGIEKLMDKQGMASDNITLTIDKNIQQIVENALDQAIEDNKVEDGAAAIVMDPSTGEVLAMSSKPDFDLNNPYSIPKGLSESKWAEMTDTEKMEYLADNVWKNKAIADTYEPGSVFKAITAAAGMEEGVISPDSMVDDYTVAVKGFKIDCWKPNAHGVESFREAVYNSCNPPFVKIAQTIGIDKFYDYINKFGFYDPTGIELCGESKSMIHKEPKEIDMAVASFGQRFQVTPLQVLCAYSAVANGGKLVKPQIIKEIRDAKGNMVKEFEPQVVRRVISEQTSKNLREILEGAVSEGTGKDAYVEGYRIAGKTGTSETREKGRYIASFAGFAPSNNPKVVCMVIMDNPKGDYYGGVTAAPVAGKIIKQSIEYIEK